MVDAFAARWRSWHDRCNGAEADRVGVRLQLHPFGPRSARAARVGGEPGLRARRTGHSAHRAPLPHHSRHHDRLPTDTAPAASQTLLPTQHALPSVPDLAPSHHTQLHLLVRTIFLRHENANRVVDAERLEATNGTGMPQASTRPISLEAGCSELADSG